MIRKLNSTGYVLESERASANFGGWEAGVFRPRTAAQQHRKAMDIFKRANLTVPLNPAQNPARSRKTAVRWDDGSAG